MVAENYPQLKADAAFRDLQAQLEGTENRITWARTQFNEQVQDFNTTVRRFPGSMLAGMFGFLLQWPTLLTLAMFPILVAMYGRLAVTEEREMRARFGAEFDAYAARTPRFVPAIGKRASAV